MTRTKLDLNSPARPVLLLLLLEKIELLRPTTGTDPDSRKTINYNWLHVEHRGFEVPRCAHDLDIGLSREMW